MHPISCLLFPSTARFLRIPAASFLIFWLLILSWRIFARFCRRKACFDTLCLSLMPISPSMLVSLCNNCTCESYDLWNESSRFDDLLRVALITTSKIGKDLGRCLSVAPPHQLVGLSDLVFPIVFGTAIRLSSWLPEAFRIGPCIASCSSSVSIMTTRRLLASSAVTFAANNMAAVSLGFVHSSRLISLAKVFAQVVILARSRVLVASICRRLCINRIP
ncbi:LOW QUALITY PROTEIN: hypothetical protein U9M48_024790 [Paspalum notatum var. saurae]|uniref:Uncharacterized protein n=1 Tax=Paspalum notatum var. saurae TaxID=547442 RepID=A0AAQ3TPH6_PASNO